MRPFLPLYLFTFLTSVIACAPTEQTTEPSPTLLTEQELRADLRCMSGVFAAYPGPNETALTPAPDGYHPIYLSHYGRHGSRFQGSESRYVSALRRLQVADSLDNLTDYGQTLLPRIARLREYARGNGGQLSTVGVRQHEGIAERMYHRFPELFTSGAKVSARSSVVSRCRASMLAFTQSLHACDSTLDITVETDSAFMQYIANDTPEVKQLDCDTAFWYADYAAYARRHIDPARLMDQIYVNPAGLDSMRTFGELWYLAVGMQNLDLPEVDLSDLFTNDELFAASRCINYRMYICNGAAPLNRGIPLRAAHNLLRNIIESADTTVAHFASSSSIITLRFGHDSHLLRLLALMHVHNAANQETDPDRYWTAWQESQLTPMAGNLQLVYYAHEDAAADGTHDILVKILLNERETLLDAPLRPVTGPYYRWSEVRAYWLTQVHGL